MKKTLTAILCIAALAGCDKASDLESPQTSTIHVTLTADAPDTPSGTDTKVGIKGDRFSGFGTFWEEGDEVTISYKILRDNGSSLLSTESELKLTSIDNDGKATFQGDLTGNFDGYQQWIDFTAKHNCKSPSTIPSSQTMNGNSFDKKAVVMFSKPDNIKVTNDNYTSLRFEGLKFVHVCTFLNIYVKEISAQSISGDEIVKSISITAPNKWIAGRFKYNSSLDISKTEKAIITMDEKNAENSITVTVPEGTKLKDLSAMAVAAPFELSNEPLIIAIDTDKHSIKKTVNLTRNFIAAKMSTIGFRIDNSFDVKPYIKTKQTDFTFSYLGETRSFDIDANTSWDIDTESLPAGITVVKSGEMLNVTLPMSSHFGDKKFPVTLVGTGVSTTLNFVQPSLWEVNEGCKVNEDGSVLMGVGSTAPKITLKEKVKWYDISFNVKDSKGFGPGTEPMISTRVESIYSNSTLSVDHRIGGGDKGNGNYYNDELIRYKDFGATASNFNNIIYFKAGLSYTQAANSKSKSLDVICRVTYPGDDNYEQEQSTCDRGGNNWADADNGTMTVSLYNRGNGSFVITSYSLTNK